MVVPVRHTREPDVPRDELTLEIFHRLRGWRRAKHVMPWHKGWREVLGWMFDESVLFGPAFVGTIIFVVALLLSGIYWLWLNL
ncbi:MAG: hypothetical protein LBM66_01705 [Bifidobacteriaceae bacterium]|jgi:hypothetical protein|nr:hypothetical protein [Bifidobacteriaceae bacterium]